MKTIKLLLLTPILALASYGYSATLTISGTITDNGTAKSGIQVIWTDSANMTSDTATSNSSGKYTITLNTGSSTQGQAFGYIVNCKRTSVYKNLYYTPRSTTYGNVDFVYCTSGGGGSTGKLSTVSGAVTYGKDSSKFADAVVLLIEKDKGKLTKIDSSIVRRGFYSFTLPDSNKEYLIKSFLQKSNSKYKNYLPTYSDSSLKWSGGKVIAKGGNKSHYNNVYLLKGNNKGGPGFVGGKVKKGANKSSAVGDPIEGAQVMLTQNGVAVAYSISDANGDFSIDNLAYGTYTVYTEVLGLPTVTADVVVSAANPKQEGVVVSINSSGATTTVTATSIEAYGVFSQLKAFPNPVQNNFTIQFGSEIIEGEISIIDMTGKVLENKEVNNTNEAIVSFDNYEVGTYLIRITSNEDSSVIRVVKH